MLRDLMSDAMEEADAHQASQAAKPQPNGKAAGSPGALWRGRAGEEPETRVLPRSPVSGSPENKRSGLGRRLRTSQSACVC